MNQKQLAVISICARVSSQFYIAKEMISANDFADPDCETVWKTIEKVSQTDRDYGLGSVMLALDDRGKSWMREHMDITYAETDIEMYVRDMIDEVKQWRLNELVFLMLKENNLDVEKLQKGIDEYLSTNTDKSLDFKSALAETMEFLDKASEGETGLLTGIGCIDRQTGGLQDGRVLVVAARTGVGKTALSNQICMNIASRNIPVGICSLEMSTSELTLRSIAYTCQASLSGLFKADHEALGYMSNGIQQKKMADWPVYFNTDEYRLDKIINQITVWARRDKIKLAVVDHIGLVEVQGAKSANERLSEVTRALKKLAKRLDIPLILVSQLNRANDKERRPPRLSDLRDSGSIEQDADMVILLNKIMDNNDFYVRHEIDIPKNRQGPVGKVAEVITFDGITQTFRESANYTEYSQWSQ